ncbi:MAG: zf-HC2 domain-containing protein [Lachnospiraceae bacterium]|nr:zf-HC2 domain-containing protein [Lachnospiraceae bacterium]
MKKISCNVIQDLFPLYADGMLSDDSIQLVEEHLAECPACSGQLAKLKDEALSPVKKQASSADRSSKNAFKKIKRTILVKRLLSAFIAVALLLGAARVGYYFYAEKGTYVSLEDSGLVLDGDRLYATKPYLGRLSNMWSADQHSIFLIMVDTPKAAHDYPDWNGNHMLYDFADQIDPKDMDPEKSYETSLYGIENVYYLPAEYANFHFNYRDPDVWEQQSQEAAAKATLLWSSVK